MLQQYDLTAPEAAALRDRAIPVGNVLVLDDHARVLVGRRHPEVAYAPRMWNLPGGRCEEGESYDETAARELREEFGIDLAPPELRPWRGYCCVYEDRVVNAMYFVADVRSPVRLRVAKDEFSSGRFVPLARVARWDLAFRQQSVIQDYVAAHAAAPTK